MPDLPRYTPVADAAELLVDVSLHRGGKARWRIAVDDLEAFLARRRTQPKPPAPWKKRTAGFSRKYFT